MNEHPTITALRATDTSQVSPRPWDGVYNVYDERQHLVAQLVSDPDVAYIAAAVNAAPHLLAELDELRAQVAAAREVIGALKWASHSILCATTAVRLGPCDCGAAEANRRLAAAVALLNSEDK